MENALRNTKFLNFSRKTDAPVHDCKLSNENNSPEIRLKRGASKHPEDYLALEQRVLWWFCQKGIRRGEPCSLLEGCQQVQRKKIAEER